MKKLPILILFVIFFNIIFVGTVYGQVMEVTLEKAVELAVAENLDFKSAGIELQGKKRSKNSSWNSFLPSIQLSTGLNAGAQLFTNQGVTVPKLGDPGTVRFTAGLSLDLPINAALATGIQKLAADYEGGLVSYESAQKKLERDVQKQFYFLLGSAENIAIQKLNMELAEKRLNQTRSNYENGLAPELDVLGAQVTLENLKPNYNKELMDYQNSLLLFKFLLGLGREQEIELSGNLKTDIYNLNSQKLIGAYLGKRLDIQQLNKDLDSLKFSKKSVALNANTPTLRLGYQYGVSASNTDQNQQGAPQDPWSNFTDDSTLSMSLSWKVDGLIPGSKTNVNLKEWQDRIDILELALKKAYETGGIEITNLVNTLDTNRKTIQANTLSVDLARRNFELSEEAYQVGTKELLEVETAQKELLAASQQLLFAKYQYLAALLDLEYALNAPIEEFVNLSP